MGDDGAVGDVTRVRKLALLTGAFAASTLAAMLLSILRAMTSRASAISLETLSTQPLSLKPLFGQFITGPSEPMPPRSTFPFEPWMQQSKPFLVMARLPQSAVSPAMVRSAGISLAAIASPVSRFTRVTSPLLRWNAGGSW